MTRTRKRLDDDSQGAQMFACPACSAAEYEVRTATGSIPVTVKIKFVSRALGTGGFARDPRPNNGYRTNFSCPPRSEHPCLGVHPLQQIDSEDGFNGAIFLSVLATSTESMVGIRLWIGRSKDTLVSLFGNSSYRGGRLWVYGSRGWPCDIPQNKQAGQKPEL